MIQRLIRWFLNPWIILGSLFFGVFLLVLLILLLVFTRPAPVTASLPPTALVTVISQPTATPDPPTPTPPSQETPTPSEAPPPEPGDIALGSFVQIAGTGGDGLRLRVEPGLDNQVRLLGLEAEVFQVLDGPREADGFTWWYLVAPFDESQNGWAVSNYLSVTTHAP
jgi:hypothetical protein